MALHLTKIEKWLAGRYQKARAHSRKFLKQMRNRKLRRTPVEEKPNTKEYKDYEF